VDAAVGHSGDLLLEREEELRALASLVDLARGGEGGAVLIEGEAGIGKSRLLTRARAIGAERGLTVLAARGSELERDIPNGVVRQLVAAVEADAPAAGFAALHALSWRVAELAASVPHLVVVDDAHWADPASLRFLAYLGARLEGAPIALVIGARPRGAAGAPDPLDLIAAGPRARLLRPAPLSAAAAGRLLGRVFGDEPDEALVSACHDAARGNPFLLAELAAALAAEGRAPRASEAGRARELAPDAVVRSVRLRLAALAPAAAAVAESVALLGDDVEPRLAAALAGVEPGAAAGAADALRAAGLLLVQDRLAFAHPMVARAVLAGIPPGALGRRHAQAARLLDGDGAPPERVASQLLEAERAGSEWATGVLVEAARRARAQGAPDAAAAYLGRALAEPAPAALRAGLILELGSAEAAAGRPAACDHLRAALALADDDAAALRAAQALGVALSFAGRLDEATAVFDAALDRIPEERRELRMAVEAALLGAGMLDVRAAGALAPRAARLHAAVVASAAAPGNALAVLAVWSAFVNRPAADTAALAERALGTSGVLGTSVLHACAALVFAERDERARALLDEAVRRAGEAGSAPAFAAGACFRALLALRAGELAEAEADARRSIEIGRSHGLGLFVPFALGVLAEVLAERGADAPEAAPGDAAVSLHEAFLLSGRARLALAGRRPQDALADLRACEDLLDRLAITSPAVIAWRSLAAHARLLMGQNAEARRLAAQEMALARAHGAPRVLGVALRAMGLAEGGERGLGLLRESASVLERSGARLERARTQHELGAALRRAGRRADAREPLEAAMDLAHRCGALALEEEARTELRAAGARPRRPVRSGADALTASERRVAAMAADGLSNRDIAQALFVTARTVETHLAHAYRKLGIASRAELRAALGPP